MSLTWAQQIRQIDDLIQDERLDEAFKIVVAHLDADPWNIDAVHHARVIGLRCLAKGVRPVDHLTVPRTEDAVVAAYLRWAVEPTNLQRGLEVAQQITRRLNVCTEGERPFALQVKNWIIHLIQNDNKR